jgi:hypothetical protein
MQIAKVKFQKFGAGALFRLPECFYRESRGGGNLNFAVCNLQFELIAETRPERRT